MNYGLAILSYATGDVVYTKKLENTIWSNAVNEFAPLATAFEKEISRVIETYNPNVCVTERYVYQRAMGCGNVGEYVNIGLGILSKLMGYDRMVFVRASDWKVYMKEKLGDAFIAKRNDPNKVHIQDAIDLGTYYREKIWQGYMTDVEQRDSISMRIT